MATKKGASAKNTDAKAVKAFDLPSLKTDHILSGTVIAKTLKDKGIIDAFETRGSNEWVWLQAGDKFREWIKKEMAVNMPCFRVFFAFSGSQNAWYCAPKSAYQYAKDATYFGVALKDGMILNTYDDQEVQAEADKRAASIKNSWPRARVAKEKETKASKSISVEDALKALKAAGYKVTQAKSK
jgi:hypothetical protein